MRLTKRPNSKNWFLEARINGKNFVRSTKSAHKPTAQKIAEGLYRSLQIEAVNPSVDEITLVDAVDRYLAMRAETPSIDRLQSLKRVLLARIDGRILLSELSGRNLSDYVEQRRAEGCKPQTIKHGLIFIGGVIRQARRDGYSAAIVDAPTISVKATRLRYLSRSEELRLLEQLDPERLVLGYGDLRGRSALVKREIQDNYDLVLILLDTGARYGEIASLKWEQVDIENRLIKLWRSKVGNESIIYMTSRVLEVFSRRTQHKLSPMYVFTNKKGGPRGPSRQGIRRAIKRAGLLDVTVHTFRHTHATRLIQNGLSIYEVKNVLGHTDIKTTMRYAHLENVDVTQKARNVIETLNEAKQ